MITEIAEKRVITFREVDAEFNGRWVLLSRTDPNNINGERYLAAYGDGTTEDRDALRDLSFGKYDGKALLRKGYVPEDGIYECGTVAL